LVAFPLGLFGSIAKAYTLKITGDTTFQVFGVWEGILIGSVTTVGFTGFLLYVHFKLFAIPKDLFTGPMFGKGGPLFGGNPAIFRQFLATGLCLTGAGLGYVISVPIFKVDTIGIGLFLLMPGLATSVLLIELWKKSHRNGDASKEN
jgi:hypothetical protein